MPSRYGSPALAPGALLANRLLFAGLALASFSVTFSVTICEVGLALAAAAAIARSFLGGASRTLRSLYSSAQLRRLFGAWLWVLLAGALSAVLGIDPLRSFSAINSDLVKLGACLLLVYICDAGLVRRVKPYYIAGACVSVAYGLWQVFAFTFKGEGLVRARGTLSAVTYAEVVAMAAIAAGAAFFYASGKRRLFYGLAALLLCCGVLASQGRASWAALLLALLTMVPAVGRAQRKLLAVALALLFVTLGVFYPYSRRMQAVPAFVSALYHSAVTGKKPELGKNISGWDRLEMWHAGISIWRDYPLFGVGPANIRKTFDFYHPKPLSGQGDEFGLANVHNLFLQHAVERGLFGLAALLALMGALFHAAWSWFSRVRDENTLWLLAVLPAFVVMNLTETSFQHALPAFSLFFAVAAAWASAAES